MRLRRIYVTAGCLACLLIFNLFAFMRNAHVAPSCDYLRHVSERFSFLDESWPSDHCVCSSCTGVRNISTANALHWWKRMFRADGRLAFDCTSRTATVVCPGHSPNALDSRVKQVLSSSTDVWGINDVSVIDGFRFKFMHVEPPESGEYYGHKFAFDANMSQTIVLCEQNCHLLAKGMLSRYDFRDYFTYKRACFQADCAGDLGSRAYAYQPRQFPGRVMVPMGNSVNRVADIVARLGYGRLIWAGCDGTPRHLQTGELHAVSFRGELLHPAQMYGYNDWGLTLGDFVYLFLRHNKIETFSATPLPFGCANGTRHTTLHTTTHGDVELTAHELCASSHVIS